MFCFLNNLGQRKKQQRKQKQLKKKRQMMRKSMRLKMVRFWWFLCNKKNHLMVKLSLACFLK